MMSPKKQLKTLRNATAPSKQFKTTLWSQLSAVWDSEYPGMQFSWSRALAVPVAVIVIFVTMGTGVYAYSSPEVTEGTALYPVKHGIERVEARFPRSGVARARFENRMALRRFLEGKVREDREHINRKDLRELRNRYLESRVRFDETK